MRCSHVATVRARCTLSSGGRGGRLKYRMRAPVPHVRLPPPATGTGHPVTFSGRGRSRDRGRSAMLLARLASSDDQPAQAQPQRLSRVLAGLSSTQFDGAILAIALPALGSILLDAVMLLFDTGARFRMSCHMAA